MGGSIAIGASLLGGVSAVNSLTGGSIADAITGGGGSGSSGSGSSGAYDPFASSRGQYATQLNDLMANPNHAMSMPGYQASLQSGQQSTLAGLASTGQVQSGAQQAALQTVGQNTLSSAYNSQLANLMQLSGASQNPAAGQLAGAQINAARNAQFTSGLGQLAGIASNPTLQSYFGGGGGSSGSTADLWSGSTGGGGWSGTGDFSLGAWGY